MNIDTFLFFSNIFLKAVKAYVHWWLFLCLILLKKILTDDTVNIRLLELLFNSTLISY